MLVVFHVCHAVLSVSCLWGRADLLAFLCVIFSCILSLSHIVLGQAGGQAWYLIVSIPNRCILSYSNSQTVEPRWAQLKTRIRLWPTNGRFRLGSPLNLETGPPTEWFELSISRPLS